MLLRNLAHRSLARSPAVLSSPVRTFHGAAFPKLRLTGSTSTRSKSLALRPYQLTRLSLQRYATTPTSPVDHVDAKRESRIAEKELSADPELVSTDSSVRHVFREEGVEQPERDIDMLAGIKSDLNTIKETFALREVPREAFNIGMAGVLPYLVTSMSTVYLAWDINYAHANGVGFLVSGQTAEALLHILEPLQIGYGAVIISFLGAIHWGLEFAKYGGSYHGYRRYAIGVVAPAVAWPTMLLPVEYALITQFLAFVFLYFADARATVRGWAPAWYSTYRFVLTFVVGVSIVLSLIGRGEIADKIGKLPGPADRVKALRDSQWENLEREERERQAAAAAVEEAQDDEDEEEDDEGKEEGGDDE
ncbi:MAG: hypothetical protein M1817_003092 [Caeruleum heppii]|nr:MAG: hypothetical protein M1817_003092 [Caeruleum heppii]